jgi:hypothetical protein
MDSEEFGLELSRNHCLLGYLSDCGFAVRRQAQHLSQQIPRLQALPSRHADDTICEKFNGDDKRAFIANYLCPKFLCRGCFCLCVT